MASWDAYTEDPNKTVSEYFRVPVWVLHAVAYRGVLRFGAYMMMCGVNACRKYRQTHSFVFGDDLGSPWDDEITDNTFAARFKRWLSSV